MSKGKVKNDKQSSSTSGERTRHNRSADLLSHLRSEEIISEGFDAFILLKSLSFMDENFNRRCKEYFFSLVSLRDG